MAVQPLQIAAQGCVHPCTLSQLREEMRRDKIIVGIKGTESARILPIQSHTDISKKQQTQVDSITTSL